VTLFIYLTLTLFIYLNVTLFVYLAVTLFVYLAVTVRLSGCEFIRLSGCDFIRFWLWLYSFIWLWLYSFIWLWLYSFIWLWLYSFITRPFSINLTQTSSISTSFSTVYNLSDTSWTAPIYLGFVVVPCIFKHSNKTPNQMQQSIVKLIALSPRRWSTCFGHYYAHHQELFQTAVAASGSRMNVAVDVFPVVVGLLVTNRKLQ
jgi:hypothetical protein